MANNQLSLTCSFIAAKPTEFVGANNFAVRTIYVDNTTNSQYPSTPEFRLKGDKVNLVDNLKKGDQIVLHFNIEGRRFTSKTTGKDGIINELSVWKIDQVTLRSAGAPVPPRTQQAPPAAPQPPTTSHMPAGAAAFATADNGDDLPF